MLRLTSQTTVEPVSLSEFKTYLRIESTDSTAEDGLMKSYLTAARIAAENLTKRALVESSWQLTIDVFENTTMVVELPRPPLSTVSADVVITYVKDNTAGDTTTIGSTVYTVDPDSEPGRVYPTYGNEWPDDIRDQRKAITFAYASGYTTSNVVSDSIKTWIKMRAAAMYEQREPFVMGTDIRNLRYEFVDGMLDPYIIPTVST